MTSSQHIICPSCLSTNKVPVSRISEAAKCGKCHSELLTGQVLDVNITQFNKFISRGTLLMFLL